MASGQAPPVGLWFTGELIPWLRASGERVAVVITDRAEALPSLNELADLVVTLGPLDPDEVHAHLCRASANFSPELTSEELGRYIQAAVSQPAVLSALLVVFEAYSRADAEVPT